MVEGGFSNNTQPAVYYVEPAYPFVYICGNGAGLWASHGDGSLFSDRLWLGKQSEESCVKDAQGVSICGKLHSFFYVEKSQELTRPWLRL